MEYNIMINDLPLPCPCCGGASQIFEIKEKDFKYENDIAGWYINCITCWIETFGKSRDVVTKKWNTRINTNG